MIFGFIGSGNMGGAIIGGIINSDIASPENVIVSDKNEQALKNINEKYGVKVGDIYTLSEPVTHGVAWFYNESWDDDGIWCFVLTKLEEITETN